MPTPPKPFVVLKNEKKSHRTKAELKLREKGEQALSTGVTLRERPEVKANKLAHREFLRLNKLLKTIQKNDAIYETVINRYCLIVGECAGFEENVEKFYEGLKELEDEYHNSNGELTPSEYFKLKTEMQKQIISLDKQIQSKRKMLLDMEKENIMTIAAALRSIPKKDNKPKSKLLEALNGR